MNILSLDANSKYSIFCCKVREYLCVFISLKSVLLYLTAVVLLWKRDVNKTSPERLLHVQFASCIQRIRWKLPSKASVHSFPEKWVFRDFPSKLWKTETVKCIDPIGKWAKLKTPNTFKCLRNPWTYFVC